MKSTGCWGDTVTDPSHDNPLLRLLSQLQEWHRSAESEAFWNTTTEHQHSAERLCDQTKESVVWLELRGRAKEAALLEAELSDFMDTVWEFGATSRLEYPPESSRCRERREEMVEACSRLAGCVEDIDSQLPVSVWEGFDG